MSSSNRSRPRGPCKAELPRVSKAYADYRSKGLEVLGVSCDNDPGNLSSFLANHPEMAWPQLFDGKHPGWHPLATRYGIEAIPVMLLIDTRGVVRTVDARVNLEQLIPALLKE